MIRSFIIQAIIDYWKRCIDFKGVTTKKDYWIPTAIVILIVLALNIVTDPNASGWSAADILTLVLVLPSISATIRRFHDMNKSGFLWLINLVPGIGSIIVFFMMFGNFNYHNNRWYEEDKTHSEYKDLIDN